MRTILEALSKWNPPAGAIRSVAVDVAERTGEHTATVHVRRSAESTVKVVLRLGYFDAMNLGMVEVHHKLTVAAIDAWKAAEAAAKAEPHQHQSQQHAKAKAAAPAA